MEDTEIISLLFQRKESALDEIIRQYGKLLKYFVRRILPTLQDIEECINDTLYDIWNTIPPQNPQSLASYASMLARRRAIDKIRHMTAEKRGGGLYPVALDELSDCIPGKAAFDEDSEVLKDAINSFLGSLPKNDRLIFVGRYFAFQSIESLASDLHVSKNTINIRLSRIRKKLRTWLEERNIYI